MIDYEPAPGSDEALDAGCSCPVLDNGHGRGRFGKGKQYVYNLECPVHCDTEQNNE